MALIGYTLTTRQRDHSPLPTPDERLLALGRLRQQILILHLSHSDLDASVVAWALYDGAKSADELQMQSGDQQEPPYRSVLDAMRDGWFVIQIPTLPYFVRGQEHEVGHLPYEYVLERRVEVDG